jgi:hypothetical protein
VAEHVTRQASEKRQQGIVAQRHSSHVEQCIFVTLPTPKGQTGPVTSLDRRPDPKVLPVMQEVVARPRLNPEEQIRNGGERATFTSFIPSIDNVKLGLWLKGKGLPTKRSVEFEIQIDEPH